MRLSFSLKLWRRDVAKGACIGAMENGIGAKDAVLLARYCRTSCLLSIGWGA